jgi:CO/xanthine dehydrogenase Mo-binding subunit
VAWYARISAPSIISTLLKLPLKEGVDPQAVVAFADQPYAIPNVRIEYAQRNPHVPVGFWRTVGHSQNPFMRECFVDELAQAAGKDPYEYRRGFLPAATKEYGVLEATAKAAGWAEQSNFHDYRMMRLREMPKVEVVLAPSGGFWGGIGEPGQAAIAPAICNALFAATGKRVRSLPLKNHGFEIA